MRATMLCSWIALSALLGQNADSPKTPPTDGMTPEIVARGIVSRGDPVRLEHVLAKARRGEPITVGVIGGSITAGAGASAEENRWGNRVAQWWRERFPNAEIRFVNAGIGATGSDIGAHRVREHLLKKQPDFVAVEFAVNDGALPIAAETLEGLIRQILGQSNRPAVLLLFTMNKAGGNAQAFHAPIGEHYGLPMVSFRDALWPEVESGHLKWEDIEADEVHPNDRGHACCARLVADVLDKTLEQLPNDANLPSVADMPVPKTGDTFEHTAWLNAATTVPVANRGWDRFEDPGFGPFFGPGWRAVEPGDVLEFDVEGTAVGIVFYRIKGATGIAEASVDGGNPVKMDAWFDADWGGYTPYQLVARELGPGTHRLRIALLDEMNPGSSGHEFRVHGILTAGNK